MPAVFPRVYSLTNTTQVAGTPPLYNVGLKTLDGNLINAANSTTVVRLFGPNNFLLDLCRYYRAYTTANGR